MKLQAMYELAVELAIQHDPRSKAEIQKRLKALKKEYEELKGKKKEWFDKDRLWNPYGDTRVLFGDPKKEIKKVAVGVDMEVPELLLIDRLNEKGAKIDMVLAHHPEGSGLLNLTSVMPIQTDLLETLGVPVNMGEKILSGRMEKIDSNLHSGNITRTTEAAKLLGMPYACFHTVADNHVWHFLTKEICEKKWDTLGDIVEALEKIPEFEEACRLGMGPRISVGSKSSRPGKVAATGMTGGTGGDEKIVEKMAAAGIGTVLSMHESEKFLDEYKKHNINSIICSHMASDSIGLNLLLDQIEAQGVEIVPMSGFIRVSRRKGVQG